MTLKVPTAKVPRYKTMVIPPTDLEPPAGVKAEATTSEAPPPPRKLDIPVLDIQMPLPEPAVVVTAVTTAVVAVGTTSITSSLFEPIKKKVQKFLQGKIDAWKKKRKEKKEKVSLAS
tara:strand:- start:59 stop:409 length:351 start_codon:yes stop_codon:yes gene_type:complete